MQIYDYADPRPAASFIVGNPPFIGNKRMREALGDGYVKALWRAYEPVPAVGIDPAPVARADEGVVAENDFRGGGAGIKLVLDKLHDHVYRRKFLGNPPSTAATSICTKGVPAHSRGACQVARALRRGTAPFRTGSLCSCG